MNDEAPVFKATYEDLRKYRILIATPAYGGMVHANFMTSLMDLTRHLTQAGMDFNMYTLTGESLIPRARNDCAHFFMNRTNYTHMLFLDADIGFDKQAVLDLLLVHHSDPEKYQLLTALYPKKALAWEKVYAAAVSGKIENPLDLQKYVADLVFNSLDDQQSISLNRPVSVREAGTGFMLISRELLDKFAKTYYTRRYISDMVRSEAVDEEVVMYFQSEIDPESNRYLSEDYLFCKMVRDMGDQVWTLPWINLSHTGSFRYTGNVEAMAQMNLPLTSTVETKNLYKKET